MGYSTKKHHGSFKVPFLWVPPQLPRLKLMSPVCFSRLRYRSFHGEPAMFFYWGAAQRHIGPRLPPPPPFSTLSMFYEDGVGPPFFNEKWGWATAQFLQKIGGVQPHPPTPDPHVNASFEMGLCVCVCGETECPATAFSEILSRGIRLPVTDLIQRSRSPEGKQLRTLSYVPASQQGPLFARGNQADTHRTRDSSVVLETHQLYSKD